MEPLYPGALPWSLSTWFSLFFIINIIVVLVISLTSFVDLLITKLYMSFISIWKCSKSSWQIGYLIYDFDLQASSISSIDRDDKLKLPLCCSTECIELLSFCVWPHSRKKNSIDWIFWNCKRSIDDNSYRKTPTSRYFSVLFSLINISVIP